MSTNDARRKAKADKDRADYHARKARKAREAEERAMWAAEEQRLVAERARLRAEEYRLTLAEQERQAEERRLAWAAEQEECRKNPPRDGLCADSAESGGCYHFRDGPEREECRASCRMLRRHEEPRPARRGTTGGGWLAMALVLAAVGHEEPR